MHLRDLSFKNQPPNCQTQALFGRVRDSGPYHSGYLHLNGARTVSKLDDLLYQRINKGILKIYSRLTELIIIFLYFFLSLYLNF